MRDEVVGALGNPGKVTHAKLTAVTQGERERQPGRVTQSTETFGKRPRL